MKTLFILVDALKSTYLTHDNMPFLYALSQKGKYIKNIIPSPGFCERSEIFTGLDSYDSGNFCAIGYLPEQSSYCKEKMPLFVFEMLGLLSKRYARSLAWHYYYKKQFSMGVYQIPYRSLSKYALTEDGKDNFVVKENILDSIIASGKTYTLDFFTSLNLRNNTRDIRRTIDECLNEGIDFIPYYIGEVDDAGHKYGNETEKIRPVLMKVDQIIEKLVTYALSQKYGVVVLGDHGMVPVSSRIDIEATIGRTKLKLHRDYEMFLDSTLARFWTYHPEASSIIRAELMNLHDFGIVIDSANCNQWRIPMDILCADGSPVYGDIIWCANSGVLISPDYFNPSSKELLGMHGYLKNCIGDGTGLLVSYYEGCEAEWSRQLHLSGVCGLICRMISVTPPNSTGWERKIT